MLRRHLAPLVLVAPLLAACGNSASHASATSTGSGAGGSDAGAGGGGGAPPAPHLTPDPQFVPKATGACPDFASGMATFSPAGIPARPVLLWVGTPATPPGPLVFVWHGAGGDPTDTTAILGTDAIAAIQAEGGIVAAPYHDPALTTLPWYMTTGGTQQDDFQVADEVLACAIAARGVDMRRIHSVGFSAGAMNTEQFMVWRSGYLASEVAYSGALIGSPAPEDPANLYPAMLFFGGPNDMVIVNFSDATAKYHADLTANGQFSFVCDHGLGHTVPPDGPPSAWQFLKDHPFGVRPEPYAKALPAGFPKYCTL
jgi:predicted esterase